MTMSIQVSPGLFISGSIRTATILLTNPEEELCAYLAELYLIGIGGNKVATSGVVAVTIAGNSEVGASFALKMPAAGLYKLVLDVHVGNRLLRRFEVADYDVIDAHADVEVGPITWLL